MAESGPDHLTAPAAALAGPAGSGLPGWATLVRADNPGPMTLDGTNTWVLRAAPGEPAVVIDPGPCDEDHLRAVAAHGPVGTVLVTHGHDDHVGGLARFLDLTGAELAGPDDLAGGGRRHGLAVTAVPTPGHTADSVCYEIAAGGQRAVFTGDTILGRGTTVIAWPDGDLGAYLDSLGALAAYEGVAALPGHGPALADCAAAAGFYLAHRRARLDQVRALVAEGATTPAQIVERAYGDVPADLRFAAEWSVRAQLAYLEREHAGEPVGLDRP